MWHFKTTNVPVIMRAMDMIEQGTARYLRVPSDMRYKIIALYGTAHLFRGITSTELRSITTKRQQKHKYIEYI